MAAARHYYGFEKLLNDVNDFYFLLNARPTRSDDNNSDWASTFAHNRDVGGNISKKEGDFGVIGDNNNNGNYLL
jgi:hypothetical protein